MSSSIRSKYTAWHVSNMMFGRVLDFARDLAKETAFTSEERVWVDAFERKIAEFGTYSPDVSVDELFAAAEEVEFWRNVLRELAQRIFKREIGNQADQSWQAATIWAALDLARVLHSSAQLMRQDALPENDAPRWADPKRDEEEN